MKKPAILFAGLLMGVLIVNAQNLSGQWMVYDESGISYTNDVCTDGDGSIYTLGYFLEMIIQGNALTSMPQGQFNIFISKVDTAGNLVWLKHVAEGNDCRGKSIVSDQEGNIIFTGYFNDNVYVCDTSFIEDNYTGELIVKIDPDGNCLWVNYVDFIGSFGPLPPAVDEENNIYLATAGHTVINGDSADGGTVITKFDENGQVIWMKSTEIELLHTVSPGYASNTFISAGGKLFLGGYYRDTIQFAGETYISQIEFAVDPWTGDTSYFSSIERMLGMFDLDGNELKAINIVAYGGSYLQSVLANSSDEIFIQGRYASDTLFLNEDFLTDSSGYLAKYDLDLNLLALQNIQPIQTFGAVATDNFNYFSTFSTLWWDNFHILKYDRECTFLDTMTYGGGNSQPEYPRSLSSDNFNNIILGGSYTREFWIDSIFAPAYWPFNYKSFLVKFDEFTVGLQEYTSKKNFNVFPNPAREVLGVECCGLDKYENVRLAIYELSGKKVHESILDGAKLQWIDVSNITDGMYILRISSDEEWVTSKKLIISH